jgi:hypothetical protein
MSRADLAQFDSRRIAEGGMSSQYRQMIDIAGKYPYPCDWCTERFSVASELNDHTCMWHLHLRHPCKETVPAPDLPLTPHEIIEDFCCELCHRRPPNDVAADTGGQRRRDRLMSGYGRAHTPGHEADARSIWIPSTSRHSSRPVYCDDTEALYSICECHSCDPPLYAVDDINIEAMPEDHCPYACSRDGSSTRMLVSECGHEGCTCVYSFGCVVCGRRFTHADDLYAHVVEVHECVLCHARFLTPAERISHLHAVHPSCAVCGMHVSSKADLAQHTRLSHPKCGLCGKVCASEQALKQHTLDAHPVCAICAIPCLDEPSLNQHVSSHRSRRSPSSQVVRSHGGIRAFALLQA